MSSFMIHKFFSSRQSGSLPTAEKRAWHPIGDAKSHLLDELERLYWNGVEHELEAVLVALQAWQKPENSDIELSDECDSFIHGFDTFIDQVSEGSRLFAKQATSLKGKKNTEDPLQTYTALLARSYLEKVLDQKTTILKQEIRRDAGAIAKREARVPPLKRRARLLLQALGLLDIEKLVERRPAPNRLSFWKRPAIPQLRLDQFTPAGVLVLAPRHCMNCNMIIRASMYQQTETNKNNGSSSYICEDCYFKDFLERPGFIKRYKHCILREIMTPRMSRMICMCENVPRYDFNGARLSLFPVDKYAKHRSSYIGSVSCGLLKLGDVIAGAKYDGMQTVTARPKGTKWPNNGRKEEKVVVQQTVREPDDRRPKAVLTQTQSAPGREPTVKTGIATEEPAADKDIPYFLREFTEKYPFGNVHMALQIGPILIENGVQYDEEKAVITLRTPPMLHSAITRDSTRALAITDNQIRQLWWQDRPQSTKRLKSVLKQVVGTPFTGVLDRALEDSIVDAVILASRQAFDDPGLSRKDRTAWLKRLLDPILRDLKILLQPTLTIYLQSICSQLLDSSTKIAWSLTSNNCQNFCDAILPLTTFAPLVPSSVQSGTPLYVMSFVTRPAGYVRPRIQSKFDVPNGLTEEYLLRFHFGLHDDADIIDMQQEYWHDWGCFGKHIYHYQDLFPWDCTEAYGRYPVTCGECNLSKHIWAFPFDSWSMVSLHLTRGRWQYPPVENLKTVTDQDWVRNRLLTLCALEKLSHAAVAMSNNQTFRSYTEWLHKQQNPALDRLKLGGIHRAQPFSHYYEQGKYRRFFIAPWVHLSLKDQINEYELLRDGRVKLPDVEFASALYYNQSVGVGSMLNDTMDASFSNSAFGVGTSDANSGGGCGTSECASGPIGGGDGGDGGGCGGGDGGGGGGGDGGGGGGGCGGGCGGI